MDTDGNQPPETGSSAAALPAEGVVHFGEELGGVSIGTSRAQLVDERVKALYTLWQPLGWRSGGGLRLGTPRDEIPDVYLELSRVECAGYDAYVHERGETKTVLYMHEDTLWAFGLIALAHPVCR